MFTIWFGLFRVQHMCCDMSLNFLIIPPRLDYFLNMNFSELTIMNHFNRDLHLLSIPFFYKNEHRRNVQAEFLEQFQNVAKTYPVSSSGNNFEYL